MYRIIVADDEEELRRAIIRKIQWEEIGFQVVGEAENGAEALELVEKLEPDLLMTDIRMPFISGVELARQIREVRPSTQIALYSGNDTDIPFPASLLPDRFLLKAPSIFLLLPLTAGDKSDEGTDSSRSTFPPDKET